MDIYDDMEKLVSAVENLIDAKIEAQDSKLIDDITDDTVYKGISELVNAFPLTATMGSGVCYGQKVMIDEANYETLMAIIVIAYKKGLNDAINNI